MKGLAKHAPALKKQTVKINPKIFVFMMQIKPGSRVAVNAFFDRTILDAGLRLY
jgi:hypothetical protein